MARTKSFDIEKVVQAARDVFWTRGYDAAAMPDLERATGLSRSSIYNAFGSKRGLFDAAVRSYLDGIVRPRLAALEAAPDQGQGLRDYFESAADAVGADGAGEGPGRRGCLLLVSASAGGGQDGQASAAVDAYRAEVTGALAAALRRAGAPEAECDARARLLFGLLAGGMTLARINPAEAAATLRAAARISSPAVRS